MMRRRIWNKKAVIIGAASTIWVTGCSLPSENLGVELPSQMKAIQQAEKRNRTKENISIPDSVSRLLEGSTVRIEGATAGSGVLVKNTNGIYTVLTAWHVVKDNRAGEEISITTHDGLSHDATGKPIQRIGTIDMAIIQFKSNNTYQLAVAEREKEPKFEDSLFTSGFPLNSIEGRLSTSGSVIASAKVGIDQGYQLLYTNKTTPGMSGGPILNNSGKLVGIHGRGERDTSMSASSLKTGINQGVPILYYDQFLRGSTITPEVNNPKTSDDYIALARQSLGITGRAQTVVRLTTEAIKLRETTSGLFLRAYAYDDLGRYEDAIRDLDKIIARNPLNFNALGNRARAKFDSGLEEAGLQDIRRALTINPISPINHQIHGSMLFSRRRLKEALKAYDQVVFLAPAYAGGFYDRSLVRTALGNIKGAQADALEAIRLDPGDPDHFLNLGIIQHKNNEYANAIASINKSILIRPRNKVAYLNRGLAKTESKDYKGAISDYFLALTIDEDYAKAYNNIAYVMLANKKYETAEKYAGIAIEKDPLSASAYGNRALARRHLGDRAGQCSDMNKAAKRGSRLIAAHLKTKEYKWCSENI